MSELAVTFTVHGTPQPQGSKVRNRYGGIREANANTMPWRNAVAGAAQAAMLNRDIMHGPVALEAVFTFARPQTHYRTGRFAGELKPTAPTYVATTPDLDKLLRAIGDSLKGIVLKDDSQIVAVAAEKQYGPPSATVTIEPIS